jgi:hypothetical protein
MQKSLMIVLIQFFLAALSLGQSQTALTNIPSSHVPNLVKFAGVLRDDAGHPKTGAVGITLFTSNGGSAKVGDSTITQVGSTVNVGGPVNVSGEVTGQTGFFRSSNNGAIFQATQTSNGAGTAVAGIAEGTTGIGVAGSGVIGVSGFGLSNGTGVAGQGGTGVFGFSSPTSGFPRATVGVLNTTAAGSAAVYGIAQNTSGQSFGVQGYNFANTDFAAGVSGVADGDQNKTFGVTGISLSPNGTGLWGLGQG